jgi:hypothetical protein
MRRLFACRRALPPFHASMLGPRDLTCVALALIGARGSGAVLSAN